MSAKVNQHRRRKSLTCQLSLRPKLNSLRHFRRVGLQPQDQLVVVLLITTLTSLSQPLDGPRHLVNTLIELARLVSQSQPSIDLARASSFRTKMMTSWVLHHLAMDVVPHHRCLSPSDLMLSPAMQEDLWEEMLSRARTTELLVNHSHDSSNRRFRFREHLSTSNRQCRRRCITLMRPDMARLLRCPSMRPDLPRLLRCPVSRTLQL